MHTPYQSRALLPARFALPFLVTGLPLLLLASHFRYQYDLADEGGAELLMSMLAYLSLLLMRPAFELLKQDWERRWLWGFAALLLSAGLAMALLTGAKQLASIGGGLALLAILASPIDLLAPFNRG